jgi:hypothetical protein
MKKPTKEYLVPVATGQDGEMLVVALLPNNPMHDGYIVDGPIRQPVFAYTAYMQYAYGKSDIKWKMNLDTKFHRQFWDVQNAEDVMVPKDWTGTFITRELPFSEESLKSIGFSQKEIYGYSKKSDD